ncbi:MAG: hypothetical protein CBC48_00665 [bacterium TMED88]|nr:hypothetical protein [Deltaproteobacteria bacterium]OUV37327.1 MAG: hypothetical protein CBC48_00665 [bacterium TMED88]
MSELDQVLPQFQRGRLEYGGGFSNHGPMAAEALDVLGHAALIPALADIYTPRLGILEAGEVIAPEKRRESLGNGADSDWVATFCDCVQESSWDQVLAEWLPELLPGLFAAAGHGLLRTAHAVRAVRKSVSPPRVREVAYGLGYWASRYQVLPGEPGAAPVEGRSPAEWVESISPLALDERTGAFFSESVRALEGRTDFIEGVASIDLHADRDLASISSLSAVAAGRYLENPDEKVALAHGVTLASAIRLLAPQLQASDLHRAVGFATQAVGALVMTRGASGGGSSDPVDGDIRRLAAEDAEMRYVAACSAEEHAIKLCEACLREDSLLPDPRLRWAAAHAALRMGVSAGARGA